MFNIDVIIRTRNSSSFMESVLSSLDNSGGIRYKLIIVDHNSEDNTLSYIPSTSKVLRYSSKYYNYSKALNMAIEYVNHDFTLIISSHTEIHNTKAIFRACEILNTQPKVAAVTLSDTNIGLLEEKLTTKKNFNGWNGAWNTCTLYRSDLLKERNFKTEVFSAEDQEWSNWVLKKKNMNLIHMSGVGMRNHNARKFNHRKLVREWESIAYFTNNEYKRIKFIIKVVNKAGKSLKNKNLGNTLLWSKVAIALFKARFKKPVHKSNYY